MTRLLLALAAVLLLTGCGIAVAIEDNVQRYPTGAISDFWGISTSTGAGVVCYVSKLQYPSSYGWNYNIDMSAYRGSASITPYDPHSLGYFSFVLRPDAYPGYGHAYLHYYDEHGVYEGSATLDSYLTSYDNNDLHEFIKSGDAVQYYINGVYHTTPCSVSANTGYVSVSLAHAHNYNNVRMTIDDISATGHMIGINAVVTDSEQYIDASYTLRATHAHPSAEYKMNLIKVSPRETINSTVIGTSKPCGFMRWDRNTIVGENAGLYQITITRDGTKVGETTFYYQVGANLGSVNWGKEAYSVGEPATISYSLVDPDFGAYTYKIETMGISGTVDGTWNVAAGSGTVNVDLDGYNPGTEYAVFKRTEKSSGDTFEFAYDYATLTETVVILGNTTNAITGATMPDVSVAFRQGTEWYNTTSASDGSYNLTDLSTDIAITCNANVTYENHTQTINETFNSSDYDTWVSLNYDMITSGVLVSNTTDEVPFTESTDYNINYTDGKITILSTGSMVNWTDYHIDYNTTESFSISEFSFTPLAAEVYTIDLYLFNDNQTFNNTTIYGLVGSSNYHQAVENANVTIWNATWSNTTTTTATGYYRFHNLNNTTIYNINASANGYTKSDDYEVNATGNATRRDIQLDRLFTVIVKARDVASTAYIETFNAFVGANEVATTNRTAVFMNVAYGAYSIGAAATGYMPKTTTKLIDEDTTVILDLTAFPGAEYYAPHYVRFLLCDIFLQVYPGATTTVYEGDTATGDEFASGTTGTDGAITFKLSENKQYTITFINASQGIDKTITLYPKDTEYWITIGTGEPWSDYAHDPTKYITIHVTQREINDTHAFINVSYRDDLNMTTALRMWINQTNMSDVLGSEIMIDSWDSPSDHNDASHSFIVSNYRGQDYKVQVWHEHDEFGTTYTRAVRFVGLLIDLGLPTISYAYISFALLFFIGAMFGATSTSTGSIVTCVMGWVLYSIGWLGILGITGPICLALASTYAVGSAINHAARRGGYA